MFNHLKNGRTFVFLDLSNIHYTQFTMWWQLNIEKLFQCLDKDPDINKILLFGAYDEKSSNQKKRVDELKETYKDNDRFSIYFKTTRLKWDKIKGNLDSEIVYEALSQAPDFDTLILFSWDWDFAYIAEKLVLTHNKAVFIMSISSFTWAELYELERNIKDPTRFKIFDINSWEETTIKFLKQIVRGRIVLFPELIKYYNSLEETWRQKNIQLIQDLIDWKYMNQKLFDSEEDASLALLFKLKNKNNEYIFPIIKTRKREDKERLISYIKTL